MLAISRHLAIAAAVVLLLIQSAQTAWADPSDDDFFGQDGNGEMLRYATPPTVIDIRVSTL
jgi:hypothetical protein